MAALLKEDLLSRGLTEKIMAKLPFILEETNFIMGEMPRNPHKYARVAICLR